jgi:hypothetical protein
MFRTCSLLKSFHIFIFGQILFRKSNSIHIITSFEILNDVIVCTVKFIIQS